MARWIARTAVASALVAAVAAPLTLSASADTAPAVPSNPASSSASQLQSSAASLAPVPLAPLQAQAQTPASSPTPPPGGSSATANALDIPALNTCVSCTSGTSSPTSGQSNSNTTVLGIPIVNATCPGAGCTTGSNGTTSSSGAVLAVPVPGVLRLAIADWVASVDKANGTFQRGSLLDLNLNPDGSQDTTSATSQLVTLAVLEAKSATSVGDCSKAPTASGESNAVDLKLGNTPGQQSALAIIVAHADSNSSSPGSVYLASINNSIIGGGQTGGQSISIPGLTTITLLANPAANCTSGGGGTPPGTCSGVLCVVIPPLGNPPITGITTSSSGSSRASGVAGATTGPGAPVPTTGLALGILGFLLIGGGLIALATSRVARRWRSLT